MTKTPMLLTQLLLLAAGACQATLAGATTVTVQGQYANAALPVQAGAFTVSFEQSPADMPDAFGWFRLPATLTFNGQVETYRSNQMAWFGAGSGLDLRFFGAFAGNDYLQFIVFSASPMFTGSSANPTLITQADTLLSGGVYYYQNIASGGFPASGQLSAASYSAAAAAVPEVSPGLLLLLGLPAVLALARAKRAGAGAGIGIGIGIGISG